MYLFLMVLLSFALCYFSYDRTIIFMYKLKDINNLNEANNKVLVIKIFTYFFLFLLFMISMFLSKYLNANSLTYVFYVYFIFTILYIIINFKFIRHILSVKFAKEAMDKKTFEAFICAVKYTNNQLIATYRIKNDKIVI